MPILNVKFESYVTVYILSSYQNNSPFQENGHSHPQDTLTIKKHSIASGTLLTLWVTVMDKFICSKIKLIYTIWGACPDIA
jgi:hypothetical protein